MLKFQGGRSEVIKTPMIELLKYMELEIKKDEAEAKKDKFNRWLDYLSRTFSQPLYGPESSDRKRSREAFLTIIRPEVDTKAPEKNYEWNFEQLEQLKAMQKGG